MKDLNEKTYDSVLQEAADYFQAMGTSIVGDGYREIATNRSLFESYVDQLTEGATADHAAQMAQLMVNTNAGILKESSLTGIQPVASLSMPVIRKLWPKFALKDAVATEVAKTPRFVVSYTAPYLFRADSDGNEERKYIPQSFRSALDARAEYSKGDITPDGLGKDLVEADDGDAVKTVEGTKYVEVAAGAAALITFKTKVDSTPSAVKYQPIDEFVIADAFVVASEKASETSSVATLKEGSKEVRIGRRLNVYGSQVYACVGSDGTPAQVIINTDGRVDNGAGTRLPQATVAFLGGKTGDTLVLRLVGLKSTEYNEESWSVGFDIKRQDIDIPSGQHLNAPLPIEALQDMMALYQIDGTKETVDLMTNTFAMKLDKEILQFLRDSFFNQPVNEVNYDAEHLHYVDGSGVVTHDSSFSVTFDCKPAAGFAGSPKAWREEIKPLIDHLAQRIKNNTWLQAGMFVIVGNPLDVQILANVDWSFRGGQGGNMDGVDADYSIGTYVGANAYKVIASTNVPVGAMFLLFLPSTDKQMTYKYYPYTFSTEMGYVDPNRSRTPSIMMTKRHTFYSFLDAIGLIVIKNNDGKGLYSQWVPVGSKTGLNIWTKELAS